MGSIAFRIIFPLIPALFQGLPGRMPEALAAEGATVSKVPLICIDNAAGLASLPAAKWLTSCEDAAKELLYGRKSVDSASTDPSEGLKGAVKEHVVGLYTGSIPRPSASTLENTALFQHAPVPVCVARMGSLLKEVALTQSNPGVATEGAETTKNMKGDRCGDRLVFSISFGDLEVESVIPLELTFGNPELTIHQHYKNNPTRVPASTPTNGYFERSRVNGLYAYAIDQTWREFEMEVVSKRSFALSAGFEALASQVTTQLGKLNANWADPDLTAQLLECGSGVNDALKANTDAAGNVTSYQRGASQRQRAELACAAWMGLRGTIAKLAQLEFYNRVKERMARVSTTPVADLRSRVIQHCTPLRDDGSVSPSKMETYKEYLKDKCGPVIGWTRDEKKACIKDALSKKINGTGNGANGCYAEVVETYFEGQYGKLEN